MLNDGFNLHKETGIHPTITQKRVIRTRPEMTQVRRDRMLEQRVISKNDPIRVRSDFIKMQYEVEARMLLVEYEKFKVLNVYVPNSGDGRKKMTKRNW